MRSREQFPSEPRCQAQGKRDSLALARGARPKLALLGLRRGPRSGPGRGGALATRVRAHYLVRTLIARQSPQEDATMSIDDKMRTELEAAVFRRLVAHLRTRTDVQNIDLMNLAGFCRNCLSNWMKDAADEKQLAMTREASREIVYGMPYEEWKAKYQREASPEQK